MNRRLAATLVTGALLSACSGSVGSDGSSTPRPSVDRDVVLSELCSDAPQAVEVAMGIGGPSDSVASPMVDDLGRSVADLRVAGEEVLADATASLRDAVADTIGRGAAVRVFFVDGLGREAVSDLEDAFGEQPGVVAVTYHSKEESFRTYQLLTEGSAWAQDIPDDAIPAELTIEFDLGATGVPDAIETARAARGVREVSTGGVMADPGAIGAFRAAVVEACPGIELWPRLPT